MPDMDAYTLNAQNACVKDGSVFVILTRAGWQQIVYKDLSALHVQYSCFETASNRLAVMQLIAPDPCLFMHVPAIAQVAPAMHQLLYFKACLASFCVRCHE